MRAVGLTALLVAALVTGGGDAANQTIVFKLRADARTLSAAVSTATAAAGLPRARRVFRPAGKFEKRHRKYGLHLWYECVVDASDIAADAAVAALGASSSGVEKVHIQPEARLYGFGDDGTATAPNDPLYVDQKRYGVHISRYRAPRPPPAARRRAPSPPRCSAPHPPRRRRAFRAWWTWRPLGGSTAAVRAPSSRLSTRASTWTTPTSSATGGSTKAKTVRTASTTTTTAT